MTAFINDTLAKQIERGEVNYFTFYKLDFDVLDDITIIVETGANNCQVTLDMQCEPTVWAQLKEGVSDTVSSADTVYNMRRDTASSLSTTELEVFTSAPTGGTIIAQSIVTDGRLPENNPFNREAGPLLKPNTSYAYQLSNIGNEEAYLSYSFFLREV